MLTSQPWSCYYIHFFLLIYLILIFCSDINKFPVFLFKCSLRGHVHVTKDPNLSMFVMKYPTTFFLLTSSIPFLIYLTLIFGSNINKIPVSFFKCPLHSHDHVATALNASISLLKYPSTFFFYCGAFFVSSFSAISSNISYYVRRHKSSQWYFYGRESFKTPLETNIWLETFAYIINLPLLVLIWQDPQ